MAKLATPQEVSAAAQDAVEGKVTHEVAALLNTDLLAPKSRTFRRWRVTGRVHGRRMMLSPQGWDAGLGGGGVKSIWRTPEELLAWKVAT